MNPARNPKHPFLGSYKFIYLFSGKLGFNTPNNINPTNSTKTDNNKNNALIIIQRIISIVVMILVV